jgi:ATP-dependent Lon protease
MQESAQAALTYARAHGPELGLTEVDFDKIDLHVHVPEGAIPKDGPSAGITIATALISALGERPIRHDVAMTGEITLRGRVLPIGGIKEKLMAAHRNRMTTVLIPRRNQKDLVDVPRDVQRELKILMVDRMDEILSSALLPGPEKALKPKRSRARKRKTEDQPAEGQAVVPPAPAAPAN